MSKLPTLYLSGPMSGLPEDNKPAFYAAANELRARGWPVINPAENILFPGAKWADFMRVDIPQVCQCDAIAMLPGWEKSKGARLEQHIAHELGMEILFVEQLLSRATPEPQPDLWVSAAEVERLARECGSDRAFYLKNGGDVVVLNGNVPANAWAIEAVKQWREQAKAAHPSTSLDPMLNDREWDALMQAAGARSVTIYFSNRGGRVLRADVRGNDWAWQELAAMRAANTTRAAA